MRGVALGLAVFARGAEVAAAAALTDARPQSGWTAYEPLSRPYRIYEYPRHFTRAPPGAVPARRGVLPAEHIEIQVIR